MTDLRTSIRRALLSASLATVAAGSCRAESELPLPTREEQAAIRKAVTDYVATAGEADGLILRDDAAALDRAVRVRTIDRRIRVLRSRLFLVEGEGEDADGRRYPLHFYVLQAGPVFVVDTAHIPAPRSSTFAPTGAI